MHFSIFYAILVYCKRELLFKQKPSYPTVDLSLDFVVLSSYRKCFAFGYITINAISRIIFRKYCHKDLQKCRANSSLSEMEKYKRENNQPKHRHGLQMNHYKDSSLSLEYANSCEVILLWFCSNDSQQIIIF